MIRPGRLNEIYSLRNVVSPILLVLKRTLHTLLCLFVGGGGQIANFGKNKMKAVLILGITRTKGQCTTGPTATNVQ